MLIGTNVEFENVEHPVCQKILVNSEFMFHNIVTIYYI